VLKHAVLTLSLASFVALSFVLPAVESKPAASKITCAPSYRWRVRTLNDRAAGMVDPRARPTSIHRLVWIRRPPVGPRRGRLEGVERRAYRVRARLKAARLAHTARGDGDIELLVADPVTGDSLVVGFPDPGCAAAQLPRTRNAAAAARASFVSACEEPPTTHFARLRGSAIIDGIGFFGSRIGPAVARNGLELQPALRFRSSDCERLPERPMVVAAAGDIACDPDNPVFNGGRGSPRACRMQATSDLLLAQSFDVVLPLGDTQYNDGAASKFLVSYDPSWGRVKALTRPVVGNHEYLTRRARGYFRYFGRAAGVEGKGYYSYDIGAWHVVALNANCQFVHCFAGSPQERWLRADLAAHPNRCVLALWHQPYFSSGSGGGFDPVGPFWDALYDAHADVILNGHEHDYERFAPQTPSGVADLHRGIREFVVGTGGSSLGPWGTLMPNSEARDDKTFGILKLTLYPSSYDWQFIGVPGSTFTDSGSSACH